MDQALPRGDDDADTLFAAVGRTITSWEELELQLAVLHSIFIGTPRTLDALQEYGSRYGTVSPRIVAVERAGATYFIKHCDQAVEGKFKALVQDIHALVLERHRIAHGRVTAMPTHDLSERFFLGAPWYSITKLKMDVAAMDSTMVIERGKAFQALCFRTFWFSEELSPSPLSEIPFRQQFRRNRDQSERD